MPATSLNTLALTLTNATQKVVTTNVTIAMLIEFSLIILILFTVQNVNLVSPVIGLDLKILTTAPMNLALVLI